MFEQQKAILIVILICDNPLVFVIKISVYAEKLWHKQNISTDLLMKMLMEIVI